MENVSIHAPVRGATPLNLALLAYDIGFNPRPCARGDAFLLIWSFYQSTFQSTPLCEGRPTKRLFEAGEILGFNPRPCARGDYHLLKEDLSIFLFQSTPLCEGRHFRMTLHSLPYHVSIHAPVRGATESKASETIRKISVSIHAPVRGATIGHL